MEKQGVKAFFIVSLIFGMFVARSESSFPECFGKCVLDCLTKDGDKIRCAAKCGIDCIGKKPFAEIIEETSIEEVSKHTEDFCMLGCVTSLNAERNTGL